MIAVVGMLSAVLGLLVGGLLNRTAGRFPWTSPVRPGALLESGPTAVRPGVIECGTAVLFALVALCFGLSWELPAFLFLAAIAVLLAVIDVQHQRLPNQVVLPSIGIGAALLLFPAAAHGEWGDLLRAGLGGSVLFVAYLVLALLFPAGMGMGDVKLAALLGLYLGWLGWEALFIGAAAGFVVQAVLALGLLALRRIGLRSELPFGPAMLLGAGLVIGWGTALAA